MKLLAIAFEPLRHHGVISALTRRELASRYRGSLFGSAWMVITPLLMLSIYTLVFGVIFKSRWPGQAGQGVGAIAVQLYMGLLMNGLLQETMGRAPGLILEQTNYVTKVVFPLQTLPWVTLLTGLFHFALGLLLLMMFDLLTGGGLHVTLLCLPLVLAPYALCLLGLSALFASLGVYLRDLRQVMPALITIMMFLSPMFYARTNSPPLMQHLMMLNPLTVPIEQARAVVIDGRWPAWGVLGVYAAAALVVYALGQRVFARLRPGFADVI